MDLLMKTLVHSATHAQQLNRVPLILPGLKNAIEKQAIKICPGLDHG